jgi:hypothetical protein
MIKVTDAPYSFSDSSSWMKVKRVKEADFMIIGRRRVASPVPKEEAKKLGPEGMMKKLPELLKKSRTWTYRVAFLKDGKLVPMESTHKLGPVDLKMEWDPEHLKWKGTEDPKYWEMGKGFKDRGVGEYAYANTYNSAFDPPPKIGDIITVSPAGIKKFTGDDGLPHYTWMFPIIRNLRPERDKPDDVEVIEKLVKASAAVRGESVRPGFLNLPVHIQELCLLDDESPWNLDPHRELLEAKKLTHEQEREELRRIMGDWYMVRQKDAQDYFFVIMNHERGIWSDEEREGLKKGLKKVKETGDEKLLRELWQEYKPFVLMSSLEEVKSKAQKAADSSADVSAAVAAALSKDPPKPSEIDVEKIVNLGNVHGDLRMRSPMGEYAIGWTLDTPSVLLQFLSDGRSEYLIRDKFLNNQPGDKIVAEPKCEGTICDDYLIDLKESTQPLVWLTIVNPERQVYKVEPSGVGSTKKASARFVFRDRGRVAYGVAKSDRYYEYFLFFEKHKDLSGRWGVQRLKTGRQYEKVPADFWMMNRPHATQLPYILTHKRSTEEGKAKSEGVSAIYWNPEILDYLEKKHPSILEGVKKERISKKKEEFTPPTWGKARRKSSEVKKSAPLIAGDSPLYVYGVFLIPNRVDEDGHRISEEEILKAIRRADDLGLAIQHAPEADGMRVTQIFQAPANFSINGHTVQAGSGVIEIEVQNPEVIEKIRKGEFGGLSIRGEAAINPEGWLEDVFLKEISLVTRPAVPGVVGVRS